MEELQDAIEDAQYVNAIATQDDIRPVLPWAKPSYEELEEWKRVKLEKYRKKSRSNRPTPFEFDWVLGQEIGLYLFSTYLKEDKGDYIRICFLEEVCRFKRSSGRSGLRRVRAICRDFLTPPETDASTGLPRKVPRTYIEEFDLLREIPTSPVLDAEGLAQAMKSSFDYPTCSECALGVKGSLREEVLAKHQDMEMLFRYKARSSELQPQEAARSDRKPSLSDSPSEDSAALHAQTPTGENQLDTSIFDKLECMVVEDLRKTYWDEYQVSESYRKLLDFIWYRDRPVVPSDFFVMRVLGRGGFGLVTACKKGTSGKLYAMKVMDKKRIKMKKSEPLAINERQALAAVESKFVANLKYSFHSKEEVYLILDLMTGGDLGFHLHQKGKFPKNECLYYAARIMLALQALHDEKYVYRDLKPENCLLAEDGRVKITDLGLATKITPKLHGAAGTRGYWAPEMLRRDSNGKRTPYGHTVDWFSFGCCLAEFITGSNPFRSEAALNYGLERGKQTKEKAIDCATMEMDPVFPPSKFEPESADLCQKLLKKNEKERLGHNGCSEIMAHPWFSDVKWDLILSDKFPPPYVPPKDVNAMSQSEIGQFAEDKTYQETTLTERDEGVYSDWDWTNPRAYASEVLEFLIYERKTGEPLVPHTQHASCCCDIL